MKKKYENVKQKNNKENSMDVVFLLDSSGSMAGCEDNTINGYNDYLLSLKGKNVKVTTVLFDDKYELLTDREDIKKINLLDRNKYYVRGCTALMDAIGKTINYLDSKENNKVIFIITTDGLENSSVEYTKKDVKALINKHKNWEFMYLGANIDSYDEASKIGIKKENTSNYQKEGKGVKKMFNALSKASECFYENSVIEKNWKKDVETN